MPRRQDFPAQLTSNRGKPTNLGKMKRVHVDPSMRGVRVWRTRIRIVWCHVASNGTRSPPVAQPNPTQPNPPNLILSSLIYSISRTWVFSFHYFICSIGKVKYPEKEIHKILNRIWKMCSVVIVLFRVIYIVHSQITIDTSWQI